MGHIYIIKNKLNNLVYIGQTVQSIEERFKQHIYCSSIEGYETKFYSAIKQLGVENFYVDNIVTCENGELNKLEQTYIEKYNSFNEGYNSTPGGGSGARKEIDTDKFIQEYNSGVSLAIIAIHFEIVIQTAMNIRDRLNLPKERQQTRIENSKKKVAKYDAQFRLLGIYETIKEAIEDLKISNYGYCYIKQACLNGGIAYGFRWQLVSELMGADNKIYNTVYDKYECEELQSDSIEENGVTHVDNIDYVKYVGVGAAKTCEECGNRLEKNGVCNSCRIQSNKIKHDTAMLDRSNKIRDLVNQEKSLSEIGRQLGISANAIKAECIKYNIEYGTKHRDEDIVGVGCNGERIEGKINDVVDWLLSTKSYSSTKYAVKTKIRKYLDTEKVAYEYKWYKLSKIEMPH